MSSYRKKHVKSKIHNAKPKKTIFKKMWFWILFLVLVIILSGFYFTLFYPGIQVKNIIISGNNKINAEELQSVIMSNANTGLIKFWKLEITSRSILLVNTNKIDQEILKEFPIIEKIQINKRLPQTLTLGIVERSPVGVYCSGSADNNQKCFLIDENGITYEPSITTDNFIIVRQAAENGEVFTGEDVVNKNVITAISEIQKDLQDNFQINVKEALITSPLRLNIQTNDGWQIYFNLEGDPDINSQIVKLNLLLNGAVTPDVRKTLQYIDLRFKDMASYK